MFKFLNPGPRYSWKKVVLIIALSTLFCSGGSAAGYFFYRTSMQTTFNVRAIVQSSPMYPLLQTAYLAEVLELSVDQANQVELQKGVERLLATHVIREAKLKKIRQDILHIEYSLRKPVAYLANYTNTAIDCEGVLFPYLPFFLPAVLPHVYVAALPSNPWGEKIEMTLLTDLLKRFGPGEIERIDLSQFQAPSVGLRQIVLVLKGGSILRLTPKNYVQELKHYFILAREMGQRASVIDLRNPEVAYITYER